jgi:hypothetical protein
LLRSHLGLESVARIYNPDMKHFDDKK